MILGGTLSTPAKGAASLWTPDDTCASVTLISATSRALKNSLEHSSGALSSDEREEIVSEGHPQTPGKGA